MESCSFQAAAPAPKYLILVGHLILVSDVMKCKRVSHGLFDTCILHTINGIYSINNIDWINIYTCC